MLMSEEVEEKTARSEGILEQQHVKLMKNSNADRKRIRTMSEEEGKSYFGRSKIMSHEIVDIIVNKRRFLQKVTLCFWVLLVFQKPVNMLNML